MLLVNEEQLETTATILHADLDAFHASVEQLLDPSLRGEAIAVGGGVVLAASYEARAYGVRGGMPGRRARELCPQLVFVGGHFQDYQRLGDAVIKVINDFTPLVERISIDEAFADAPPWDSTKPLGGSLLLVNEERLETTATILHADLDAFYASVEQLTL